MQYVRKGHILIDEDGNKTVKTRKVGKDEVPAINAAKRESRELQAAGHTVRKG